MGRPSRAPRPPAGLAGVRGERRRSAPARVLACALAGVLLAAPLPAAAAPDPTIAALLSTGSTLFPLAVAGGLLATGAGAEDDARFSVSLGAIGAGTIIGPSVGQIYAGGGVDAWVTFFLRIVTGGVVVAGSGLALRGTGDAKGAGRALIIVGAVPSVFLAGWDIYGAAQAAREARYREGHAPSAALPPHDSGRLAGCDLLP